MSGRRGAEAVDVFFTGSHGEPSPDTQRGAGPRSTGTGRDSWWAGGPSSAWLRDPSVALPRLKAGRGTASFGLSPPPPGRPSGSIPLWTV